MEEVFGGILFTVVLFFAVIGGFHVFADVRHFDQIQQQCEKQGFIQNTKTRILCQLEGAK